MSRTPQRLRIGSRGQFDWLISHLATEANRACDHWHLLSGLETAFDEYSKEINETPRFWELTRRSHQDSVVLRLGRLFDPTKGALSLGNFLQTIQDRVTNPDLASLGLDVPGLDIAAIREELKSVSDSDPWVSRLMGLRNRYLAHREAYIVSQGSFSSLPELRWEDIETLLNRASQICDKYCQLYERPERSSRLPGPEDCEHLLHLVKLGLQAI